MTVLPRLFARMLYDVGRGYGAKEVKEFIKYIDSLNNEREKMMVVKRVLQIAIVGKATKDMEIIETLIEETFKNFNKDVIKNVIEVLVNHKYITESKLKTYLLPVEARIWG